MILSKRAFRVGVAGPVGSGKTARIGRVNLDATAYGLIGSDRANVFTGRNARIQSFFFAAEPSIDFNWIRHPRRRPVRERRRQPL